MIKTYYVGNKVLKESKEIKYYTDAYISYLDYLWLYKSGTISNIPYDSILFECNDNDFILLEKLKGTIIRKIDFDLDELQGSVYYDINEGRCIKANEAFRRIMKSSK